MNRNRPAFRLRGSLPSRSYGRGVYGGGGLSGLGVPIPPAAAIPIIKEGSKILNKFVSETLFRGLFGPTKAFQERQARRDSYYGAIDEFERSLLPRVDARLVSEIKEDIAYLRHACSQRCGYPDDTERVREYFAKWEQMERDLISQITVDPIYGEKVPPGGNVVVVDPRSGGPGGAVDLAGFQLPTWAVLAAAGAFVYKMVGK
jgi:hypothetical protein